MNQNKQKLFLVGSELGQALLATRNKAFVLQFLTLLFGLKVQLRDTRARLVPGLVIWFKATGTISYKSYAQTNVQSA